MEKFTQKHNGWEYSFYKEGKSYCCDISGTFDRMTMKCTSAHDIFVYLNRMTFVPYDFPNKDQILEFIDAESYTFINAVNKAISMKRQTVYFNKVVVRVFNDGSVGQDDTGDTSALLPIGRFGWRVGKK